MLSDVLLMSVFNIVYKMACLASGVVICFFGYRLFSLSYNPTGDLKLESNLFKMSINKAAQGTFFALFGAFVVAFTIWKGINIDIDQPATMQSGNNCVQR
jgi:hypothetical protein